MWGVFGRVLIALFVWFVVLPLAFWGSVAAVLKFLKWASVITSTSSVSKKTEPNLAQWITYAYAMEGLVPAMFCDSGSG